MKQFFMWQSSIRTYYMPASVQLQIWRGNIFRLFVAISYQCETLFLIGPFKLNTYDNIGSDYIDMSWM